MLCTSPRSLCPAFGVEVFLAAAGVVAGVAEALDGERRGPGHRGDGEFK